MNLTRPSKLVWILLCALSIHLSVGSLPFPNRSEAKTTFRFASSSTSAFVFQGFFDHAGCDKLFGWAWDSSAPNSPIDVAIWDNGNFLRTVRADKFRPDLPGNQNHAFDIATPDSLKDGKSHSIRITISGFNDIELSNSPKSITCTPVDNIRPTVISFTASATSISPGGSLLFDYTISDSGGSGLSRAELFRAPDSGGKPGTWSGIKSSSHSGNGPASGSFTDSLSATGTYWYGLHAVDNAGLEGFEPDPPGPLRVIVSPSCSQPSITTNPADQSISSGQQATLSVLAGGSAPLSYQWYRGSSGNTSNPVSGATSASVTVQPASTTSYWVLVSNSCGGANSNAATVFVNAPALPDLTIEAGVANSYASGQTNVKVPVTVFRSGGSLPTSGVYVLSRLYWSTSPNFSQSAVQLWESNGSTPDFPVSVLNSSGSRGVTATLTLPPVSSSGTYYILAFVDPPASGFPNGFYSESNKSNNLVAYPVSISVTNKPFITVNPTSGPQQTTKFVTTGTGFTANGQVRRFLTFPNTSTPQEIAGTTANSSGQFSLSFTTDCSSTVGKYTEFFIDVATNQQSNSVTETVTASSGCNSPVVSINPSSGPQLTTTFVVTGSGFTPNGAVRQMIVFPNGITQEVSGTTANSQGQINKPFTSDCATMVGSHTIWMIDVATGKESTRAQEVVTASSQCATTPTLQVSQPSGPLGTTFGYSGTGYTPNSTVTLSVTRGDGQPGNGGKFNIDGSGNVFFVITSLSNDPTGMWTMRVKDDATARQASVTVQYTTAQQSGTDVMYYTDNSVDVTIPDNSQFAPGETKNKVWKIQNAGTNAWTNYKLVFVPGVIGNNQSVNLSSLSSIAINASPGQWINTPNLPITAPSAAGTYHSYWQMQNSDGVNFGTRIYVKIRVVPPQGNRLGFGSQTGKADSPGSKSGHNADPVNTATGNYNYETTDLRVPGRGLDLEFGRSYNSQDATPGPLGTGWSHSFNIYLIDPSSNSPAVHYSDGKIIAYVNQTGTSNYLSSYPGYYDQLIKNADNSWTLKKPDQHTYQFDNNGKLRTIRDRNGNQITLNYNGSGALSQIIDTAGRLYTLVYSGSVITSVTDPAGRKLQFSYDAASNQISFRDANNNLNTYSYDANKRLTRIVDGRGNNLLVNSYDSNNRVATQTNGRGNLWSFVYNSDGSTSVFDPNNPASNANSKPIRYTHDTNFNMQRETDRLSNQVDVRYDDRNNRSQVSDLKSNYFSYQYDPNGNVTAQTDPLLNIRQATYNSQNNPTRFTNELGALTQLSYDSKGNLLNVTDALNKITKTAYNALGQPTVTTDAKGNPTTRAYDAQGNLISVKDALNNTTSYTYDNVGRRKSMTDARGRTTNYTYDSNDNLLTVTDPSGNVITYTYDANNNRTSVRDARGNVTTYQYDENNLLLKEIDPLGNFVQHTYDKLDRRISTRDKRGNISSFEYDNEGRLIKVTDPLGNITAYTYDANGNRTQVTNPKGQSTVFTYDGLNRLSSIKDAVGNVIRKEYDPVGRLRRALDPRGNTTQFSYDAVGNLTQVLDAEGGTAKYTYDDNRNRIAQTDPKNNTAQLSYDPLNRLIASRDALNNTYTYSYDAVGNRLSQTDARGRIVQFAYDASSRLTTITYPDSTTVRLSYDAAGNVTQMVDALGTSRYTYDQLNRVTNYTDAFSKTIGYQYDANGNVIRLTYPDGKQVTYQYDAVNRLTSFTDWASKTTSYQYDSTNFVTRLTYPNGTTTTFAYNNAGRLVSKTDEPAISSYVFTLDANGNRTSASIRQPLASLNPNESQSYAYDAANRIQTSGAATFSFDPNGNMTGKTQNGVTTSYGYDFTDRLTTVSSGTQYSYNGSGVRLRKVEGGVVTRYVVDINRDLSQVLCETDGSGNITSYYVYGLGLAYKVLPDGTHFYYHFDALGSAVAMTNDARSIVNAYAYDPFGKVTNAFEGTRNPFQFVGQYGVTQESNGLVFMRARYYLPDVGRFNNKDLVPGSLTNSQALNSFAYANSNPVVFIDPRGLFLEYGGPGYRLTNWVDSKLSQAYIETSKTVPSFLACGFTLARAENACRTAGYSEAQIAVSKDIGTVGIYLGTGGVGAGVLEGIDYLLQGKGLADVMLKLQRGQISPEEALRYAVNEAAGLGLDLTLEGLVNLLGSKFPVPTDTLKYFLNNQLTGPGRQIRGVNISISGSALKK
jgi:RHS repeat-associated protein